MTCNPTTIQLSSSGTTTINVTLSSDPGDGTDVILQVDGLSFAQTVQTSSSAAVFTVTARTAANYSLWDATIQVGSNLTVDATAQVVETNGAQAIGVTITDAAVSYCSPLSGAGSGSGTVTAVNATAPIVSDGSSTTPTISHADSGVGNTTQNFITSVSTTAQGHVTAMSGSADAAAFRGNIGLKSTAVTDMGTAASNVVQLDSSSKLPAVDGSELTNLPAQVRSDSYTGQIETAADKTYTIDPRVAAARNLTYFYGRSGAGTCTGKLYNGSDVVATLAITTTSSTATLDTNYTAVSENAALTLVVSLNASATDVVFGVEYTQ